jgi:hypothetical protein
VHDDTLRPLIDARLAEGKSPITINRTLEVARAILNGAARAYRDADGFPWLEEATHQIFIRAQGRSTKSRTQPLSSRMLATTRRLLVRRVRAYRLRSPD